MEIYGYRRNYLKTIVAWIGIVLTAFLLRLVFFWKPHWHLYCTFTACPLRKARKVLLKDKYNQYSVEDIKSLVLKRSSYSKILLKAKQLQTAAFVKSRRSSSAATASTAAAALPVAKLTPISAFDTNSASQLNASATAINIDPNDTSQVGLSDDEEVLASDSSSSKKAAAGGERPARADVQTYGSLTSSPTKTAAIAASSPSVVVDIEPPTPTLTAHDNQHFIDSHNDGNNELSFLVRNSPQNSSAATNSSLVSSTSTVSSSALSSSSSENASRSFNASSATMQKRHHKIGFVDATILKPKSNPSSSSSSSSSVQITYFDSKKLRYIWDDSAQTFVRLHGLDQNVKLAELKHMLRGLNEHERRVRHLLFGDNTIHIEVQSYARILFEEVLGPFYIFQIFSVTLWFNDNYTTYASCIIIMSLVSLVSGVYQIRRNQKQLRDTVKSGDKVKVCRGSKSGASAGGSGDELVEVDSSQLVPGDVVIVPTFNTVLQFDALLINGNVIVNESMLTGESVPVTKTPMQFESSTESKSSSNNGNKQRRLKLPSNITMTDDNKTDNECAAGVKQQPQQTAEAHEIYFNEKEHSKNTLFCGTKVIQTRFYGGAHVKALVLRTGFQTTKGELIRSIMFPKPVDFKFNSQIHQFIGVLAICAFIGFVYTVVLKTMRGESIKEIIVKSLDLITITVPPALPAAMTIGIIYAQSRLRKRKIYCISPRSINISGCINCVCFDKTGTLTQDDLSFNEVVPVEANTRQFGMPFDEDIMQSIRSAWQQNDDDANSGDDIEELNNRRLFIRHKLANADGSFSPLMHCLASCHSLTKIDDKLIGDPLDLQMFEATGWVLEEPDVDDENKFDLLAPTIVKPPPPPRHNKKQQVPVVKALISVPQTPVAHNKQTVSASVTLDSIGGDSLASLIRTDDKAKSSSDEELKQLRLADESCRSSHEVGVLRQFPFTSSLQRMSVVTRQLNGNQYVVYAKGAPEKIAQLCDLRTLPANFSSVLQDYTHKGFRVIALAYRPLKVGLSYAKMQRASRAALEKDLHFLGFLTLGNLLKDETEAVIETLNNAAIRTIMITGDNMLTAISVANECGMIQSYDKTVLLEIDHSASTAKPQSHEQQQQQQQPLHSYQASVVEPQSSLASSRRRNLEREPILRSPNAAIMPLPSFKNFGVVAEQQSSSAYDNKGLLDLRRFARPKLTWRYVERTAENSSTKTNFSSSSSTTSSIAKSDSVLLKLNDNSRLHLALTGETWDVVNKFYPELLNAVCVRGTVFARMSPNQKQQLVEHLQSLQYYVGMCGDGANDSGALRAAHAGISLSDTEASVAAPFTSANANISCVPALIIEGRAALVTAFSILKYMALYSLTQFCSVILLYTVFTNFSDFEFLYEDMFIIAVIIAFFGRTRPYPVLDRKPPPSSLISAQQLSSCGFQLALVVIFQTLVCGLLWSQHWYKRKTKEDLDHNSQDTFCIFVISAFQCATLSIVFSKGKPYKRSILSNYPLALSLVVIMTTTVVILLLPPSNPLSPFKVQQIPFDFKLLLLGLALTHFCLAIFCERVIVDGWIASKGAKLLEGLGFKNDLLIFEKVDRETQSTHWLSSDVCCSSLKKTFDK